MTCLAGQPLSQRLRQLPPDCFAPVLQPLRLEQPRIERLSESTARLLGLSPAALRSEAFLTFASGQARYEPPLLAQAYAGHQLGRFNPFLGDGRAATIGSWQCASGTFDLSLKGIGKTAFARDLDGMAGLKECLHEFELSEQLAALGIPVARCLAVISGEQQVYRRGYQRAAMLLRVAPGFFRIGSFEMLRFLNNPAAIESLCDYLIEHSYPSCRQASSAHGALLEAIVAATARLIARWQQQGFTHGMMNTDNLSVQGITLDLGASSFNPGREDHYVSSPADEKGRYAFGNQPVMGLWGLNVLARCFESLLPPVAIRQALQGYENGYLQALQT